MLLLMGRRCILGLWRATVMKLLGRLGRSVYWGVLTIAMLALLNCRWRSLFNLLRLGGLLVSVERISV